MRLCSIFSMYCNPLNSSLGSREKFCGLRWYKQAIVVVATAIFTLLPPLIGSLVAFRFFTKILSPKAEQTAQKVQEVGERKLVEEAVLPPSPNLSPIKHGVSPDIETSGRPLLFSTPRDVLDPTPPNGSDPSLSTPGTKECSDLTLPNETGDSLLLDPVRRRLVFDSMSPGNSPIGPESPFLSTSGTEGSSTFDFTLPNDSTSLDYSSFSTSGTEGYSVYDPALPDVASSFLSPILRGRPMVDSEELLSSPESTPRRTFGEDVDIPRSDVSSEEEEEQDSFLDEKMGEKERKTLKNAFYRDSGLGEMALELYLKGGDLPSVSVERFSEGLAKDRFYRSIGKIVGKEKHRINFPEEGSFDDHFDWIALARNIVISPETPIPDSFLVRVLVGAVSSGIPFLSKSARFAAWKKGKNVEERLTRWQGIDTGLYEDGAKESFERLVKGCSSSYRTPVAEIPKEDQNTMEGCTFGVAHLKKRAVQENTHAQGVVQVGESCVPFFAVCAGCSGDSASKYVSEHMQEVLEKNLKNKDLEKISDALLENILSGLSVQLDAMLMKDSKNSDRLGTCLTMALILSRKGKSEVWTVNVGDSRVLAVMPSKTHQLTEDALLSAERFKQSCRRSGVDTLERVTKGITRRSARRIGDKGVQKLSPKGKVSKIEINPEEETMLVLHNGDLNKVFSANDIGDIARDRKYTTPQQKADAIVGQGSQGVVVKNLSALVVEVSLAQ